MENTQMEQLLNNSIEMGSNDLYLIKKLKESAISYEKLNSYLRKIFIAIKDINGKGEEASTKNIS